MAGRPTASRRRPRVGAPIIRPRAAIRESDGDRSSFDYDLLRVIKSSADKVHVELGFSRYQADGTAYRSARVCYTVTKQDDHWGIQVRPLMPPTFDAKN